MAAAPDVLVPADGGAATGSKTYLLINVESSNSVLLISHQNALIPNSLLVVINKLLLLLFIWWF